VARLDVDGDDVTVTWQTPISGATRGSPRVYLRKPRSDDPATEVLMVSQYFFARVDASSGELLFVTTTNESNFDDADLVAYDAASDSLYAYNDPFLVRVNANDNSIVRSTDVSAPIDFADPAVNESEYPWFFEEYFEGDWYHKAEARDFDSLHIIDDDRSLHLTVTYWGTLGRDEQEGTYVHWGTLDVDRSEFDYGDVGIVVEEEGMQGISVGTNLKAAFTDKALVVAGEQNLLGSSMDAYFVRYVSLETEEILWSASLLDRPALVAVNDARVAVLDINNHMKLWTEDGDEMASTEFPILGDAHDMVLLCQSGSTSGEVRFAATIDGETAVQTFRRDEGQNDYDRLERLDLTDHDMSHAEYLAYDDGHDAYFVGGNYDDGRRAVARFNYQYPDSTHAWTTPVDARSGSPRILLRRRHGAERATEVLLISKSFYARVDASSGDVIFQRTDSDFASSSRTAYDPVGDWLYGVDGRSVVRYDVNNGDERARVRVAYQLDVADPDMADLPLPPDNDVDLDNWFYENGEQEIEGIGVSSGDGCASHVHLFGRYHGDVVDEDHHYSWFVMSLDKWCDQDALMDERCEDDPTWHHPNEPSHDCAYVAQKASDRCDGVGDDGRAATVACRLSCGRCEIDGCDDSSTWHVRGDSDENCDWVAEKAGRRCPEEGDDDVYAWQACGRACQTCPPLVEGRCVSDSGWFAEGNPSRDCDWVGDDPEDRCLEENLDGDFAFLGCPRQCGLCNVCFVEHVITTTADGVQTVLAVDLDGDGDLDVVAASSSDDTLSWYENVLDDGSKARQFRQHNLFTDREDVAFVAAADVDGDGDLDLIASMRRSDDFGWYENTNGDASTFEKHEIDDELGGRITWVGAADIDRDGHVDPLVAWDNKIYWYENDGGRSPRFARREVTSDDFDDDVMSVIVADLDEDGDPDVAAVASPSHMSWFENGGGNFRERQITTSRVERPQALAVADIDGDDHLDLVCVDEERVAWWEHRGQSQPTFSRRTITGVDFGRTVATADIDFDGHVDIIYGSSGDNEIAWQRSDGGRNDPSFKKHVITSTADFPSSLAVADIDDDGDLDIVAGDAGHNSIVWYESVRC